MKLFSNASWGYLPPGGAFGRRHPEVAVNRKGPVAHLFHNLPPLVEQSDFVARQKDWLWGVMLCEQCPNVLHSASAWMESNRLGQTGSVPVNAVDGCAASEEGGTGCCGCVFNNACQEENHRPSQ